MTVKLMHRERRGQPSHREDLRGDLIAAAVAFVTREGYESLSMRRLAEEVGVSSGAPYHHFADRRALLAEVALAGYDLMYKSNTVPDEESEDSYAAMFSSLLGFIRFAEGNPHMFTLMYESELVRPQLAPELADAHEVGFQLFHRLATNLAPQLTDHERALRVSTIWCAIFGFALQANRAMLRAYPREPAPDELAPEIVRQALRLLE